MKYSLIISNFLEEVSMLCYAKSLQSCLTLWDNIDGSPPGSPVPGILQAKNTGVGCHFLLQCMKVKSESEVAQSCPNLCDPMHCSLPGSSVHEIFQARVLEWGATAFSPILLFSSISLHWSLRKAFLSLLAILWNSAFKWEYLSFSALLFTFLLFIAICKAN